MGSLCHVTYVMMMFPFLSWRWAQSVYYLTYLKFYIFISFKWGEISTVFNN